MRWIFFFFFKLDKDLATKLLSSQKALWPTFSTCLKVMPKEPGTCPGETALPRDGTLAASSQTQPHSTGNDTGITSKWCHNKMGMCAEEPCQTKTLCCEQTPPVHPFTAISLLI